MLVGCLTLWFCSWASVTFCWCSANMMMIAVEEYFIVGWILWRLILSNGDWADSMFSRLIFVRLEQPGPSKMLRFLVRGSPSAYHSEDTVSGEVSKTGRAHNCLIVTMISRYSALIWNQKGRQMTDWRSFVYITNTNGMGFIRRRLVPGGWFLFANDGMGYWNLFGHRPWFPDINEKPRWG